MREIPRKNSKSIFKRRNRMNVVEEKVREEGENGMREECRGSKVGPGDHESDDEDIVNLS